MNAAIWPHSARARDDRRASVLIIVMITIVFASAALVVFMDKASNDLLVEHRAARTERLRLEAYSALEVTLAVLEDFRLVGNGLHSPAEGWADPLEFAGYAPSEDRRVTIRFEDESGKISLPRTNEVVLKSLFLSWDFNEIDAAALADALFGWMKREHIYTTGLSPSYEQSELPFEEPRRSLRSYQELVAIDTVREHFYTEDGLPNEHWRRFVDSVSLLDFPGPNINGAKSDTLAAVAQLDHSQQQAIHDFLNGTGTYSNQGPGYFRTPQEAQQVSGLGDLSTFSSAITALRIHVTVEEGQSIYRLAAVVAPPNGARTVQTTATAERTEASATTARNATNPQQNQPNAARPGNPASGRGRGASQSANPNQRNLRYPFTLLEIRENDEIPPAPVPPEIPP